MHIKVGKNKPQGQRNLGSSTTFITEQNWLGFGIILHDVLFFTTFTTNSRKYTKTTKHLLKSNVKKDVIEVEITVVFNK